MWHIILVEVDHRVLGEVCGGSRVSKSKVHAEGAIKGGDRQCMLGREDEAGLVYDDVGHLTEVDILTMAEPYSPTAEARFFPGSSGGPPVARLSARDELLPQDRRESQQGLLADGSPAPPGRDRQKELIKNTQKQIDEVTEVVKENIEAISQRGERLDHLQNKTDQLSVHSQQFRTQATKVRRQMWWKNAKWTICLGVLVVIIIAGAVGGSVGGGSDEGSTPAPTVTETVVPPGP